MNDNSSKSILKSTGLVGGSKVISVLFGIIRSKVIAVILGPTGTGLIGALQSSTASIQTVVSLGLSSSSVRDIAQAYAKGNQEKIAKTIKTQRRAVLVTGLSGMLLTYAFAAPLSQLTFGDAQYTGAIRLLSIAVFFNLIMGGQGALIQGTRRIKDLALMSIISAGLSTIISVPLIYFYQEQGIPIFLVMLAASQYVVSFYFAQRIQVVKVKLDFKEIWERARGMIRLGLGFMGAALAGALVIYFIRVFIIRFIDMEALGLYQAAMGISGLYINVVLDAMGKDFYPRLTSVAYTPASEISLMNQQTEVGMILAAPGLLFTLALAPLAINILYTPEYAPAYSLLQWMILGVFMRTISWPLGFLFVARAKSIYFLATEIAVNLIHLLLVFILAQWYGLKGAAIAFFGMYILYTGGMYYLCNHQNGFTWQPHVVRSILALSAVFGLSFAILRFTEPWVGSLVVCMIGLGVSYYALQKVLEIMEVESVGSLIRKLKNKVKK